MSVFILNFVNQTNEFKGDKLMIGHICLKLLDKKETCCRRLVSCCKQSLWVLLSACCPHSSLVLSFMGSEQYEETPGVPES